MIDDALSLCEEHARKAGVRLSVEEVPKCELVVNPVHISQVLYSLLMNALEAVAHLEEEQRWARIEFRSESGGLSIAVVDGGAGIPEITSQRIMEPFFTTKEIGKGMGLGLSISKNIMEAHGGVLWLDKMSSNTRFVMDLPTSVIVRSE